MVVVLGIIVAATRAGFCSVDSMGCSSYVLRLGGFGRPTGRLNAELACVLGVQPLPAAKLHRIAASDAADGSSGEEAIQNVESNVPPGSTHGDEAAIDFVPQGQAGPAA